MNPDFGVLAFETVIEVERYPIDHSARVATVEDALRDAFNVGIERAAEIADEQGNVHKHVSNAIRAERDPQIMHSPKVLADRFRVFRFVKQTHENERRAPSYLEISSACDIPVGSIGSHIKALKKADGFPKYDNRGHHGLDYNSARPVYIREMIKGNNFDENALLLTDIFAVTDG